MQIQSVNNFSNIKSNQNPQFKSVYPVVHWLAETNGSFAPQITKEVAQEFNENIIRRLNMKKLEIDEKISSFAGYADGIKKAVKACEKEIEFEAIA